MNLLAEYVDVAVGRRIVLSMLVHVEGWLLPPFSSWGVVLLIV
jgi:hypothetical protein